MEATTEPASISTKPKKTPESAHRLSVSRGKGTASDSAAPSSAASPTCAISECGDTRNTFVPSDAAGKTSELCSHLMSPPYAGHSAHLICPVCRMDRCITDVRRAETVIKYHGSGQEWTEHILNSVSGEAQAHEYRIMRFWTGGSKKPYDHVHKNGVWLSHRRAKTNLLKLELQSSGELAWDDSEEPLDSAAKKLLAVLGGKALERLKARIADGTIGTLEEISAAHSRMRAREMELASYPAFPEPHDYYSNRRAFKLTRDQRDFIAKAPAVDAPKYEPPFKRQKRCVEAFDKVDFDPYVYTRKDRDVDALFANPMGEPEKPIKAIYEELPASPAPGGILRSIENLAPVALRFPQPLQGRMKPPPARAHTWSKLNKIGTHATNRWAWVRRPPQASPGYEVVNTSGLKNKQRRAMTFDEWDAYTTAIALPKTYNRSPEEQLLDEMEDQKVRESKPLVESAKLPSHEGIASAFVFGTSISNGVLEIAHRYLWS